MLAKFEQTFLFLTLLFMPSQLGRHFWPDFAYVYSIRVDYLSPVIYFWDLLVVGLIITWLFKKPKLYHLALNLLLIFFLSQVLSLVSAKNIGAGLVRLEQYFMAGSFGLYLASQNPAVLKKQIYLPLSISLVFESLLAIGQVLLGHTLGFWILGERTFSLSTPGIAKFDLNQYEFLRPYGTFPHPNLLAAYFLVILILLEGFKNNQRKLRYLTGLIGALTVFLSVSRTAIFAAIDVLSLSLKGQKLLWFLFLIILVSPVLFIRYGSLVNVDSLTLLRRAQLATDAFGVFRQSPVLGIGLNNFVISGGSIVAGPSRFLQPVHNIYLLALSETGLIGTFGWCLLIGLPIYKNIKNKIFLLAWGVILFLGLFDHYFLTLPQGIRLLFLCFGLSLGVKENLG